MTLVRLGPATSTPLDASRRLHRAAAHLAGVIAEVAASTAEAGAEREAVAVLRSISAAWSEGSSVDSRQADLREAEETDPIDRVAAVFGLDDLDLELLLLGALPEVHEGIAAALAALHPLGLPSVSPGLVVTLLDTGSLRTPPPVSEIDGRHLVRSALRVGRLATSGLVQLRGSAPLSRADDAFWQQAMYVESSVWECLLGIDRWPDGARPVQALEVPAEASARWLCQDDPRSAVAMLRANPRATLVVASDQPRAGWARALLIAAVAKRPAVALELDANGSVFADARSLILGCVARGVVPVIHCDGPLPRGLDELPGVLIVVRRPDSPTLDALRPQLVLHERPVGRLIRRDAWSAVLPSLGSTAVGPADLEPVDIALLASDVALARSASPRSWTRDGELRQVRRALRDRFDRNLPAGLRLVTPSVPLEQLVVDESTRRSVLEVVDRMRRSADCADLPPQERGVRVLLWGPPGSGKTMAADAIAAATDRDLLVVDLSRVVSKWLGETEKHLEAAFVAAEQGDALLFFDEADALFGRRTEIDGANDRYANLETAFLLGRLERFEGAAVLATNHRHNLDTAFLRRLEFVIGFDAPDAAARAALWRATLPRWATFGPDIDIDALADRYAFTGGHIRNIVVSAAHLARADGSPIRRRHVLRSVEREYDKAAEHYPGVPYGWDPDESELDPIETPPPDSAVLFETGADPDSERSSGEANCSVRMPCLSTHDRND